MKIIVEGFNEFGKYQTIAEIDKKRKFGNEWMLHVFFFVTVMGNGWM